MEDPHADPRLDPERLVLRHPLRRPDRAQDGLDGEQAVRRGRPRDLQRPLQRGRPAPPRRSARGSGAPAVRRALLAATSPDTVRSPAHSGKPTRLLRNKRTTAWEQPGAREPLPMPLQNLLVSDAHRRLIGRLRELR